jgi:hypothetical protein
MNDKVLLYHNCVKVQEANITKEPKELVFESASTVEGRQISFLSLMICKIFSSIWHKRVQEIPSKNLK